MGCSGSLHLSSRQKCVPRNAEGYRGHFVSLEFIDKYFNPCYMNLEKLWKMLTKILPQLPSLCKGHFLKTIFPGIRKHPNSHLLQVISGWFKVLLIDYINLEIK